MALCTWNETAAVAIITAIDGWWNTWDDAGNFSDAVESNASSMRFWHQINPKFSFTKFREYEPTAWLEDAQINAEKRWLVKQHEDNPRLCAAICLGIKRELKFERDNFGDFPGPSKIIEVETEGHLLWGYVEMDNPNQLLVLTPKKHVIGVPNARYDALEIYQLALKNWSNLHHDELKCFEKILNN